jgi:HEAT repeat protein
MQALVEKVPPIDRARTYAARAEREPGQRRERFRAAAGELERSGLLARSALYCEKAEDIPAARALWSRLSQRIDSERRDRYAAGLARFNVARMCKIAEDARGAHEATVAAVHRLEEAADRFESMGQRERAFDCYHVLIEVGQISDTFEHVLEGCVNAIRILSEDHLRFHSLRLYEHAITLAEFANEHSAAATLAREMTAYARRQGLGRIATRGTLKQAELWGRVAENVQKRSGPTHMVENALVASLLCNAELGQYREVGRLYQQLSELDLESTRKEHYARAVKRYLDARHSPLDASLGDERLGEHVGPPDVWHVDLMEWEEKGDAAEACANVLLDPSDDSDRVTRRTALVGRLAALAAHAAKPEDASFALQTLATFLAPIGLYGLLASIESLYEKPAPEVRLASIKALSRYYYKRSFVTLERAIGDADSSVVEEAISALERLRFDHAFDPLARIHRGAQNPSARLAALRAITKIDAVEAAELVLGVLEHGSPEEREAALTGLRAARGNRFLEAARAAYGGASPRLKKSLDEVLRSKGMTV